MKKLKTLLTLIVLSLNSILLIGQGAVTYTQSFTNKLRHHGIDFFQPVERWLHVTNIKEDEYMKYDVVLRDQDQLEVRVRIIEDNKKFIHHPHIEVMRMMATIATNDPTADILISQMGSDYVLEQYGADWGLFADFEPKEGFSRFSKGRVICLYKEGRALVNYIILHDDDELEAHFTMPLVFE
jgi:hypothetical protein